MSAILPLGLDIRSYRQDHGPDSHAFDQLVLPLDGALDLDIAGRGARLDAGRAAFVAAGLSHTTTSGLPNRSIIIDIDLASADAQLCERLIRRPYVELTPTAGKLIDYMGHMIGEGRASAATVGLWTPLLLDALSHAPQPGPAARLARLRAMVEADPGRAWTTGLMAQEAGLSVSRLHARFRELFGASPHAWLAGRRLDQARRMLAATSLSIAEIAHRSGYGDQSALTRAMRDATGQTPAAYRRAAQESASKA